ncbi:MAG: electron transport complex subunit RsxC [Lachnospiraceae bacterium]|nr:electron transport complex subunit RsxC [Lachnospiraceae bacterium]
MKSYGFKGGVHPLDGKELSKDKEIVDIPATKEMVYPLSQHIGAPAKAIVEKGDACLVGQTIAIGESFVSADVICTVSGTVKSIEKRMTASGNQIMSIVVDNDEEYREIEGLGREVDYQELSKEKIREIIKKSGIVGMGGAAFPTHVKLTPKNDDDIDYVIVNGAECEPYLTSDNRVMLENSKELVEGLKVILRLFDNAVGVIAIEDNKPECIKAIKELVKDENRIKVKALRTKYPQGAERNLVYAVTGRKFNSTMLPADVGCVVNNIDTVVSIYMAVCKSTPLMRRIITVTGDAVANPGNFSAKIGTNYQALVEAAGGLIGEPEKIISGGPMMGTAMFTLDVPVTKNSSAIVAMSKDEVAANEPLSCIRCGRCVAACPSGLVPQKMYEFSKHFDEENFARIGGMECYECGSCTYVCPAKLRLTQSFKETRKSIISKRRKG